MLGSNPGWILALSFNFTSQSPVYNRFDVYRHNIGESPTQVHTIKSTLATINILLHACYLSCVVPHNILLHIIRIIFRWVHKAAVYCCAKTTSTRHCMTGQYICNNTVKCLYKDTPLITSLLWIPAMYNYYPLNVDTSLIGTLFAVPRMSTMERFNCTLIAKMEDQ